MAGNTGLEIAIIGISCRFPGAPDKEAYWENLLAGTASISAFSDEEMLLSGIDVAELFRPDRIKRGGVLDEPFAFDAAFFGIGALEATALDPQQRLFLECAWEAFEDAGHVPGPGLGRVGVFAGAMQNTHLAQVLMPHRETVLALGEPAVVMANQGEFLPMRISYMLDLTGPSVAVNTACSTSLVATHMAVRSLLMGECEIALAGSAAVGFPHKAGYRSYGDASGALASDGVCRPFSAEADGMVPGSGVAAVVLKRLEDALRDRDHVYAVIKGSAVNNDGHQKVGFLAPSVEGQARAVKMALDTAEIAPERICFVEAHGTGTRLGDPIEVRALHQAFGDRPAQAPRCLLGSVKGNIGHALESAGLAGLIKASLALERRVLPPTLRCAEPNPELNLAQTPFALATVAQDWRASDDVLVAGVSSFGLGGTNVHAVLMQPPALPAREVFGAQHVLPVSARNPAQLVTALERLADHLGSGRQALVDVAYTLQAGRRAMECREAVVAGDAAQAATLLRAAALKWRHAPDAVQARVQSRPAFLFTGFGLDAPACFTALRRTDPAFARHVEACLSEGSGTLRGLLSARLCDGWEPEDTLTPAADLLANVALARLWIGWGLLPKAVGGIGAGLLAAAVVAGRASLAAALDAAQALSRAKPREGGGALVFAGRETLPVQNASGCRIDATLGDTCCLISGADDALDTLISSASARGIAARRLDRAAFLPAAVALPEDSGPRAGSSGPAFVAPSAADGEPDLLLGMLSELRRSADRVMVFGLGAVLAEQDGFARAAAFVPSLAPTDGGGAGPQAVAARLWKAGWQPDWDAMHAEDGARRTSLPTYPFERRVYRADLLGEADPGATGSPSEGEPARAADGGSEAGGEPADELHGFIVAAWTELLGVEAVGPDESFFDLGGDSLQVFRLGNRLRETFAIELSLRSLFEHATIAAQVTLIEAALLAKIEAMSAHEIEDLIQG